MSRISLHWLAPVALLLGMGSAHAQNAARADNLDPLNPQAAVPPLVHTSSFAAYRRHAAAEPIGWREANDTVTRIGGWRAYAREAAAESPAAASAASPGIVTPGTRKP